MPTTQLAAYAALSVCLCNPCRGCCQFTEALEEYDRATELAGRCSVAAFSKSHIQARIALAVLHAIRW